MPYKSDKIKIANTIHDKRIKLSDEDKIDIVNRFERGESMRSLSRSFKVDRQVIKYTIYPDYKKMFYETNRKRVKPEIEKAVRNNYMKKHRKHKHELYVKGEIEL